MTTNPIPVKAALDLAGIMDVGAPRLPLIPLSEAMRKDLKIILDRYTF
jgi:dihydrodipicolinate synthase/N-acetylneuraminate lyase